MSLMMKFYIELNFLLHLHCCEWKDWVISVHSLQLDHLLIGDSSTRTPIGWASFEMICNGFGINFATPAILGTLLTTRTDGWKSFDIIEDTGADFCDEQSSIQSLWLHADLFALMRTFVFSDSLSTIPSGARQHRKRSSFPLDLLRPLDACIASTPVATLLERALIWTERMGNSTQWEPWSMAHSVVHASKSSSPMESCRPISYVPRAADNNLWEGNCTFIHYRDWDRRKLLFNMRHGMGDCPPYKQKARALSQLHQGILMSSMRSFSKPWRYSLWRWRRTTSRSLRTRSGWLLSSASFPGLCAEGHLSGLSPSWTRPRQIRVRTSWHAWDSAYDLSVCLRPGLFFFTTDLKKADLWPWRRSSRSLSGPTSSLLTIKPFTALAPKSASSFTSFQEEEERGTCNSSWKSSMTRLAWMAPLFAWCPSIW